jgi:hypothetical protein
MPCIINSANTRSFASKPLKVFDEYFTPLKICVAMFSIIIPQEKEIRLL